MDKIEQFDIVLLKDGRSGAVVEIYGEQEVFAIDIGSSPCDCETITVKRAEIDRKMLIEEEWLKQCNQDLVGQGYSREDALELINTLS